MQNLTKVIGNKIRFNWALNTAYGDENYTCICKSEKQAISIANAIEIAFPNGENFNALMELSTLMKKGFSLIETKNVFDFPYLIKINSLFYCIQNNEVYYYNDDIKHLL